MGEVEEQSVFETVHEYLCSEVETEASTTCQRNKVYQNEVNNHQHTKRALHAAYQKTLAARTWTQDVDTYIHTEIPNATVTPQLLSPRRRSLALLFQKINQKSPFFI